MTAVTMPRLSDTMTEGVISTWLKHEGDMIERGDVLAEIETDKATMELEAYDAGVLSRIVVGPGQSVPVGETIAVIGEDSPTTVPDEAAQSTEPPASVEQAVRDDEAAPAAPAAPAGKVRATPLVRSLARQHDIDLTTVAGSGPHGRIVRADLEPMLTGSATTPATSTTPTPTPTPAPAPSAEVSAAGDRRVELTTVKRVTARRMSESATVPQFSLTRTLDAGPLLELRRRLKEDLEQVPGSTAGLPSVNDLLIRAVALVLREHPEVNSSWAQDHLVQHEHVNIGYAVAAPSGLVVVVVRDADQLSLSAIATQTHELTERAREGRLSLPEVSGGTFTISNLGMFGVDHFTAVVNPPEAAILSVGTAREEAVVRDGELQAATMMALTVTSDHRVLDGAQSAGFLADLVRMLEKPLRLVV